MKFNLYFIERFSFFYEKGGEVYCVKTKLFCTLRRRIILLGMCRRMREDGTMLWWYEREWKILENSVLCGDVRQKE